MSKKEKRLSSKKRKLEALVNIASLNDEDRKKRRKSTSDSDSSSEGTNTEEKNVCQPEPEATKKSSESTDIKDDIKKLQEDYRAKRKLNMALPKIFLSLDKTEPSFTEKEPGEEIREKANETWQPMLFCSDLQRLLLYCIQGNLASHKPRWCTLLRPGKVKHALVIVVDDVGGSELEQYKNSFKYLHKNFEMSVELACPMQYNRTVPEELFQVINRRKERLAVCEDVTKERSEFSCLDLLLNSQQMVEEGYPLPVSNGHCRHYVFSCEREYSEVHEKSPMFAIDCEMCLSEHHHLVLTRVAVVDENLNLLYESLVKPSVCIKDYVTRFSGITKKMLDPITTTLKDVQGEIRKLLPPDAIICGQSLNSDLHALEMYHPYVIDTSVIFNLSGFRHKKPGLRRLTAQLLGRNIQDDPSGHNPCEDAIATMELVNLKLSKGLDFGNVILRGSYEDVQDSKEADKVIAPANASSENAGSHIEDNQKESDEEKMQEEVKSMVPENEGSKIESQGTEERNSFSDGLKLVFFRRDLYESFFIIAKNHTKSVVLIGREVDTKQYQEKTDTILAETDKIIANKVTESYDKYDMTYCNLNGFTRCLNQSLEENQIKEKLQKIDHRLKKMTKDLKQGTIVCILFSGRVSGSQTHNAKLFIQSVIH